MNHAVNISDKELKYVYLMSCRGNIIEEKVDEIRELTSEINKGNHTIRKVFKKNEREKIIYEAPRIRKVIECIKSFER